jgi:hypothetical protein
MVTTTDHVTPLRNPVSTEAGELHPGRGASVNPSDQVRRALRQSIAGQYGGAR